MLTTIMKWIASAALLGNLLLPVLLGYHALGYHAVLQFLVAAGAAVVVFQAAAMREYRWMVAFGVVACLFNPIVPIGFSAAPAMVLNTITLLLFGLSLKLLKTPPRLSIASITDRMPGSESL
jgi:uncharacterized protein DUF6804